MNFFPERKTAELSAPAELSQPIEQHQQLLARLIEGSVTAIRSTGEYALEMETGDSGPIAAELDRLALNLSESLAPEVWVSVQAGVRVACQEHRDRSSEKLTQLRRKTQAAWAAAQAAVGEFAEGLSAGTGIHEEGIQPQLERLKTATSGGDLPRIRRALEEATEGLRRSQIQLERSQRMVIIQLQDEVRVLRETMETRHRQHDRDPELPVWRRHEMDRRIQSRIREGAPFAVLAVSIHNLKSLGTSYCPEVLTSLLEAMVKRLSGVVGPRAEIGRWTPNAFAVILPIAPALAPAVCDDVHRHLAGAYAVQIEGRSLHLALDLSAGLVNVGDASKAI